MEIHPIIEYMDLERHPTGRADHPWQLYNPKDYEGHAYWGPVHAALMEKCGLYIFYDSLTKPLYVGITNSQPIFNRACQSYSAQRNRNGAILTVKHPSNNTRYDPSRPRRLHRTGFCLADVAEYFSAYRVDEESLPGLEAFAIRAFGATLLNTKMEGNGGFGLTRPKDYEK